jgi:hypothetical protein
LGQKYVKQIKSSVSEKSAISAYTLKTSTASNCSPSPIRDYIIVTKV